jgi:ribosome-associated heat shock protein Hsp15
LKSGRAPGNIPDAGSPGGRQRLDKYLWFARVTKTRALAAKLVSGGQVRINAERVTSPSKAVAPGDVLTITLERAIRVLKVLQPGSRRGPYEEARLLYEEIVEDTTAAPSPETFSGPRPDQGRPDKRLRRQGADMKRGI